MAVGFSATSGRQWSQVSEIEVLPACDIGLLKASVPDPRTFPWSSGPEELPILADVQIFGYPYALDLAERTLQVRAFKGHIVSVGRVAALPSRPACYALSFAAPRGLSGAPVLSVGQHLRVEGVVVGNKSTEMTVFTDRERVASFCPETA